MSPLIERAEYRNDSGQIIGVVTIDRKGDDHARGLLPGETIWLSEDERRATARAPRDPADNPFEKGWLTRLQDHRLTEADDRPIDSKQPAPPPEAPQEARGGVEATEGKVERVQQPRSPVAPAEAEEKRERVPAGVTSSPEAQAAQAEEEHADFREETGAAPPPSGHPVEGEYAAAEEVGDPEAAAQGGKKVEDSSAISTPPPRPPRPSDEG